MSNVYQHFHKDEHRLIDKIIEWKERVEETYVPVVSAFMTPRQLKVASTLFSKEDVVQLYVSSLGIERKRVVISHKTTTDIDFEETILTIDYPHKFHQLQHHQILGTLIHAGVKREVIGDIITNGTDWQVIVANAIVPFLTQEIQSIGRVKVKLTKSDTLVQQQQDITVKDSLLSSLRLDAFLSEAFNMSRSQAKSAVEKGLVFVNWEQCEKPELSVLEGDMISVRGVGRVLLSAINGTTQKGKIKVTLHLFGKQKR